LAPKSLEVLCDAVNIHGKRVMTISVDKNELQAGQDIETMRLTWNWIQGMQQFPPGSNPYNVTPQDISLNYPLTLL
jgi:hypothetical protein